MRTAMLRCMNSTSQHNDLSDKPTTHPHLYQHMWQQLRTLQRQQPLSLNTNTTT